ncbi:MAG: methyl-accepting chemotaxis protein [Erythrobacter sp.]
MSSLDHTFDAVREVSLLDEADEPVRGRRFMLRSDWFSGMSISGKLNFAVFANTVVLAIVGLLMLSGTNHLGKNGQHLTMLTSIELSANNAAIAMVDVVDGLETAEATSSQEARADAVGEAQSALDRAREALLEPITLAGEDMPANAGPLLDRYVSGIEALRTRLEAAVDDPQQLAGLSNEAEALFDEISTFAIGYRASVQANADALFAQISTFLIAFVIILLVGLAVSMLGTRHIVTDIAGVIRALTGSMDKVAKGNTDTAIPGGERKDEIGAMARSLGVFRDSMLELRDLTNKRASEIELRLAQQKRDSEEMRTLRAEKSKLLENMADGFEVSVGELITAVSAASEQLKATSKQMVDVADGSNEQAESATEAMEQATANVTAAAAATDEFALSIGEISRQASASASLARDATELVTTANTRMSDLAQAADEIGEIANLIQTIAQRTNLLALNASIEAARGGEAGRGFAVVASEVKELAMQTSNATSSVAERIAAMQDSTKLSAGDLASIVQQIGELEQTAVMIASAVDQQSVSGEELARNIDTVASGSGQVGKRLEALRAASEETGSAADDVVASARALGDHAENLRDKAGRFIENVRRSAKELDVGEAA